MAGKAASNTVKEIQNARRKSPNKYADMDDYAVYQSLRQERNSATFSLLKGTFNTLTFGNRRARGRIERGGQLTANEATIARYQDDIAAIKKELSVGKGMPWGMSDAKRLELEKQLKVLQQGLKSYSLRKGTGSVNSPYLRSLFADDVIISTAIGIGSAALPVDYTKFGVDGDTMVALTAPIFAPLISRAAVSVGSGTVNIITDNTIKDVGLMLENTSFLPFITPGTIVTGDESKMRAVMAEVGRAVTDEDVIAFTQLNKLFNQMTPEYREKSYQALIDYNKMMNGFQDDMSSIGMTAEDIAEAMPTLHLTVAQATGIAPFLAFQRANTQDLNAANFTKKMPEIMKVIESEESTLEGMSTNLNLIKELIRKRSGVDLDSNASLQQLLNDTAESIAFQKGNLNKKKQEMYVALQEFVNNVGSSDGIDTNTVEQLLELETILDVGTIEDIVSRGKRINKIHGQIVVSAQKELEELKNISSNLTSSQFNTEMRRIADIMFDAEMGRRKAIVSGEYRIANQMIEGDALDMTTVLRRLANMDEEVKDKPLSETFGGRKGFFNRAGGKELHRSLKTMARRGLRQKFAEETIEALLTQRRMDNENFDEIDLALELMENSNENLDFLLASPSEVENVYRFFRDKAIDLNRQKQFSKKLEATITQEFLDVIDGVYSQKSPELLKQVQKARKKHADVIGSRTDKNRYAQQVRDGRIRKNPADENSRYYYANEKDAPEASFQKIAVLAGKAVNEADPTDTLLEIRKEKQRIMYFLGGGQDENGDLIFDFREPKQKRNAYLAQNLLETMIGKQISDQMAREANLSIEILNEGMDVTSKNMNYNFKKAMRIIDIENELRVNYIDENGVLQTTGGVELDAVKNSAARWDKLVKTNKDIQKQDEEIRARIDTTSGVLGIAQKKELDEITDTISQLRTTSQIINNPKQFYAAYFENATAQSYREAVELFIQESGGKLTEEQVRASMKYMYIRGMFERAGVKTKMDGPSGKLRGDVDNINTFIDDVNDPRKREVMLEVLGEEHVGHLLRIARWSSYSMGDALDFRAGKATKGLSLDSVFSRVFNIARGMVSPLYVGTETATRLMLENKQNLINLAMQDRQAAEFMANVLTRPERLTELDIKTFGLRVETYLARAAAEQGLKIRSLYEQYSVPEEGEENKDETVQQRAS